MDSTNTVLVNVPVRKASALAGEFEFVMETREFSVQDLETQNEFDALVESFTKVMKAYFLNGENADERRKRVESIRGEVKQIYRSLRAECPPCPYGGRCRNGECDYTTRKD